MPHFTTFQQIEKYYSTCELNHMNSRCRQVAIEVLSLMRSNWTIDEKALIDKGMRKAVHTNNRILFKAFPASWYEWDEEKCYIKPPAHLINPYL